MLIQWKRVNDMVITWLLNCVSDEISDGMNFVNSAKDVWDELQTGFLVSMDTKYIKFSRIYML